MGGMWENKWVKTAVEAMAAWGLSIHIEHRTCSCLISLRRGGQGNGKGGTQLHIKIAFRARSQLYNAIQPLESCFLREKADYICCTK